MDHGHKLWEQTGGAILTNREIYLDHQVWAETARHQGKREPECRVINKQAYYEVGIYGVISHCDPLHATCACLCERMLSVRGAP